ncbi:MAG: asparagine synthase (glutamine-hydrolyzing) [Phycisphaeraceae bacterium]|nr:asparagine synthase (glutamine-hydrolyzing) [Phycisphaeraceae bacterium]
MCGLAGFVDSIGSLSDPAIVLEAMHRSIAHRGPDDSGTWFDRATGIGFAHRRLAIVDLSAEGHQPMLSEHGRFRMVFNGEVYNFRELRAALEPLGHRFRGHSDTEVMLAAFEEWGVEAAVRRFVGMFAFAVHDAKEGLLHLVRDRLGVKPLYYGWIGDGGRDRAIFAFASELKALLEIPGFERRVDRDALSSYLRFAYVPGPRTIYRGISKLVPGHLLTRRIPSGETTLSCYWSAREMALAGVNEPLQLSDAEAVEALDAHVSDAISLRMVADVPLGAFLSGGVDSSLVVATMQRLSSRPVRTFTIGFEDAAYDEARYAERVARHLGTDHTTLMLSPAETIETIPRIPDLYDEPFADSSQIPTFLVSRLARSKVTVSLSGDGGDELFGGYNRYFHGHGIWQRMERLPLGLRRGLASLADWMPERLIDTVGGAIRPLLPKAYQQKRPAQKVRKLALMARSTSGEAVYRNLVSMWLNPDHAVIDGHEPSDFIHEPELRALMPDMMRQMMYTDLLTYLVDDILTKVDRASMGVSLEAREPLLDHRLVEFAWRLPLHQKIRNGHGKFVMRELLARSVPRENFERPKMGFSLPIDDWLRGPLREWAESLVEPSRLAREGFFRPESVQAELRRYLSGLAGHPRIWAVLMFQAWVDRYRPVG